MSIRHNCISRLWLVVASALYFYLNQKSNFTLKKQTYTHLVKLRFIWGFHTAITYIIINSLACCVRVCLPILFFFLNIKLYFVFNFCFHICSCFLLASFSFLLYSRCCWHWVHTTLNYYFSCSCKSIFPTKLR